MPSNPDRTLHFQELSPSGRLSFKYYSTGCLVISDPQRPNKTKSGLEVGFMRINNLDLEATEDEIFAFLALLDKAVDTSLSLTVDYFPPAHSDLLRSVLASSLEPRLLFALLIAGIYETANVSLDCLVELNPKLPEDLDLLYSTNTLEFALRPDYGVISSERRSRARSDEDAKLLIESFAIPEPQEIYSLALQRFHGPEKTIYKHIRGYDKQQKLNQVRQYLAGSHYSHFTTTFPFFTREEFLAFDAYVRLVQKETTLKLDTELQRLLAYSWISYGAERTEGLLRFLWKFGRNEGSLEHWRPISYDSLNYPLGEVDEKLLLRALASDPGLEFEWAVDLEV